MCKAGSPAFGLPPAHFRPCPVVSEDRLGCLVGEHVRLVDVDRMRPVACRVNYAGLHHYLRIGRLTCPIRRAARGQRQARQQQQRLHLVSPLRCRRQRAWRLGWP